MSEMTVKQLKLMGDGEKLDSLDLYFETAGPVKTGASGRRHQTVTFKDASGDKVSTTVFDIAKDVDWGKTPVGSVIRVTKIVMGTYTPQGSGVGIKRIDDCRIALVAGATPLAKTTSSPSKGKPAAPATGGTTLGAPEIVSEREKHDYYKAKDDLILRQTALNASTAFWAGPNVVQIFGADALKNGFFDPLVVLETASIYYHWFRGNSLPEVSARLVEILKLEVLTAEHPGVIPAEEFLKRFLMSSGGLKDIREAVEKQIAADAEKDNPAK